MATAILGGVAALIAIVGLLRMQTLNHQLTQIVDLAAEQVRLADLLRQDLVTVTRAEQFIILADSAEEAERYAEGIEASLENIQQRTELLHKLASGEDRQRLDEFSRLGEEWVANHQQVATYAQLESDIRARQLSLGQAAEDAERVLAAAAALKQRYEGEFEQTSGDQPQQDAYRKIQATGDITLGILQWQRAEKDLILSDTEHQIDRYDLTVAQLQEQLRDALDTLESLDEAEDDVERVREALASYVAASTEIGQLVRDGGGFLAEYLAKTVGEPLAYQCEMLLDQIAARSEEALRTFQEDSGRTYTAARNSLVLVSAIGILVSMTVSFCTGQRIAANLRTLADYAQHIQLTGDLSEPLPEVSRDEVGELASAFDDMRSRLYDQTTRLAALNTTLEHKTQEMEQFVYTVSHDLSSPLVSCKGLIGLIKEDLSDGDYEEVRALTDKLDEATDQLRQIIDDLLALSRVGRKLPQRSRVDVRALLTDLKQELVDRLEAAGADLQIDPEIPAVTADPSHTKRVFENLLTNAIKYGVRGKGSWIRAGGAAVNGEIRYFVRDNGPGIDPAYHQKIFGLFQRLDPSKQGTGLGLASVVKIMNMHGGRAWVQSEPGEGATFWVAFPENGKDSGQPARSNNVRETPR